MALKCTILSPIFQNFPKPQPERAKFALFLGSIFQFFRNSGRQVPVPPSYSLLKKYLVKIRLKTLEILDTPLMMKFMVQCRVKYGQAPPPIIFPMAAPVRDKYIYTLKMKVPLPSGMSPLPFGHSGASAVV